MADFTHLHVHTEYSLLDGLNRTEDLFKKTKELGMKSLAITDHGVLYGIPEFWKMGKDFDIKPIIGCEIYLAPTDMTLRQDVNGIRFYHLLLLAKNQKGYINLVKLVSESHLKGFYYRPRVDLNLLKKHSEGLICTSACLAGPISRHILRDELDQAEKWAKTLHKIFKDDFYLELQRNGLKCEDEIDQEIIKTIEENQRDDHESHMKSQIKVNKKLYDYSKKLKIPLIATTDAHYLNKEDREAQKVVFCIRDGRQLNDPKGLNGYVGTYIQSPEELKETYSDIPEVLEETMKIDEKIEKINLKPDRVQPKYWNLPEGKESKDELREQVYAGAKNKFKKLTKEIKDQLDLELSTIDTMGYNDYFLVVGDIMQYARRERIVVGVRGSAAGSLVAFVLDITDVNPLTWGLVFERFLNLERMSPPDIDMDIQDDRRDDVIDYVREKYGEESVAVIITFGTLKTRAAIRDVARVLGIDLAIADKLSKMVTVLFGKPFSFEKMMETDKEFREMVEGSKDLMRLKDIVIKIENLNRHTGVHAAGYLVTPGPLGDFMAYQKDPKNENQYLTQMDGNWVDKLDFMKFDFLGLRTFTILRNTIKLAEERHGVKIHLSELKLDPNLNPSEYDEKAMEIFAKGETVGVFQSESPPMTKYFMQLKPKNLEDICFMFAAYRPGPMEYIPDYISIRNGEKEPEYLFPELEPILKSTLGFPVYQEQLLQICMKFGGFTLGEGDVLRNALKKKQLDILKKKEPDFKKYFVENFDFGKEVANKLWKQLEPFASYGFNKAHSAGYAIVGYWCAYLKANYPLEFVTALMHSDLESADRMVINLKEAKRLGYEILAPDVNKSVVYFEPEGDDSIRVGLGVIKNVGAKICSKIVEEREKNSEFKSLDDFVTRMIPYGISKKAVEHLIKAGSFDSMLEKVYKGGNRNQLIDKVAGIFGNAEKKAKAKSVGQESLFGSVKEEGANYNPKTELSSDIEEESVQQRLKWEKELIGMYHSSHPLDDYAWVYTHPKVSIASDLEISQRGDGSKKIFGVLSSLRKLKTRRTNETMATAVVEDISGAIDVVFFPSVYKEYENSDLLDESIPCIFEGHLNERNDFVSFVIKSVTRISTKPPKELDIDLVGEEDEAKLLELSKHMLEKGSDEEIKVSVRYGGKGKEKSFERYVDINSVQSALALNGVKVRWN